MHGSWHAQLDDNAPPDIASVPAPDAGVNSPMPGSTSSQPSSSPPVVLLPRVREDRAGAHHSDDPCDRPDQPDSVGRRGVPVPVVLVPGSDRTLGDVDPQANSDEDYSHEQHSVEGDIDGDPLSDDDLGTALAEDTTLDDGVMNAVATVVHIYILMGCLVYPVSTRLM